MCEVPIFYATTEGQTRRVAERLAAQIQKHGLDAQAIAIVSGQRPAVDWSRVRGVAVGASVHAQGHQREAVAFARQHCAQLSMVPSLFFSVCLAAASTNPSEVEAARQIATGFTAKTGWRPTRVAAVAGRLAYTQYNWFVRRIMRRIAIKEGGSPDMSRDHEYTDWAQVEQLGDELAYEVRRLEVCARTAAPSAAGV